MRHLSSAKALFDGLCDRFCGKSIFLHLYCKCLLTQTMPKTPSSSLHSAGLMVDLNVFFFGEGVRYFRGVCMVQKEHLCLFGTRRSFFFFSRCLLKMLHCVSDILSCPVRYHGKLAASCGFQAFQSASHISCQARADVFYG